MSNIRRLSISFFLVSILLAVTFGCAANKTGLMKENEALKDEKALLKEGIEQSKKECEQEKNQLSKQMATQEKEFQKAKIAFKKDITALQDKIKRALREKDLAIDEVRVQKEKKRALISFSEQILFDKGNFRIKNEMKPVLKILANHIKKYPNRLILIEGHSCNLPVHNKALPTNWDLSGRRATEVLRYFVEEEKLPPQQFSAMSFGEYHPKVSNKTEQERMKNRRVEIVILSEELTAQFIK